MNEDEDYSFEALLEGAAMDGVISCPECGTSLEPDCPECGDFDVPGLTIVNGTINGVYGGCRSKKCTGYQTKKDGYTSGFGRRIYCDVIIEGGKVLAALNVRKEVEE